jgi:hypothetical protein
LFEIISLRHLACVAAGLASDLKFFALLLQFSESIFSLGDLEKCRPWHFSPRKAKNAVFASLHFQSLAVI